MTLKGNLDVSGVHEIERLALHAWPGLEVESLNGWLLRHASGVTRRANSVWPNRRDVSADLDRQIASVESFYHARRLPARYQICPAMQPDDLDAVLAQRGYVAAARTAVQTTPLATLLPRLADAPDFDIQIQPIAGDAWWACYAAADEVARASVAARQAICAQIQSPVAYVSIREENETVAVGSAKVEAGWIGLFNIATRPDFRRRGAARAVVAALAQWGLEQGAVQCYLQVVAENEPALRIYARLGFATAYFYHYREEVGG